MMVGQLVWVVRAACWVGGDREAAIGSLLCNQDEVNSCHGGGALS